ncbi:MAG: response regulator transcription factor [Gemmatimonadota bacterium]|nr:MAG: response regulator transcription factor [Gemmatimonadota bacterium]
MQKIRALIVDDEPFAREGIRVLLRDDAEIEIVGECADGREAVAAIREFEPDLVFLDIQMPEVDGFAVIEEVGADEMPVVVFVTAYDQYALRAFDVAALDYLLKPFDDERFATAVARAKAQIRQGAVGELSSKLITLLEDQRGAVARHAPVPGSYLQRVMLKTGGRVVFLKTEEIDWIEAEGDYVRLHAGPNTHLLRDTMKRLEEQLDPAKFVRTHRSTIVNLDRIKELHPYFHGDYRIILKDGTELKLSRSRRQALEARLGWPL